MNQRTQQLKQWAETEDSSVLQAQVLTYAYGFPNLLVSSPEVLTSTVRALARLVLVSNKVLPLKSYFNICQEIQGNCYMAERLARETLTEHRSRLAQTEEGDTMDEAMMTKAFIDLYNTYVNLEHSQLRGGLIDLERHRRLAKGMAFSEEDSLNAQNQLHQEAQRHMATDHIFMLACSFMRLSVARQGSVYYLQGESFDFKETKKKRAPCALNDEIVLMSIASKCLGRSDAERGRIERAGIMAGFDAIVRRSRLDMKKGAIYEYMTTPLPDKNTLPRNVDVMEHFGLTLPDFTLIELMLREDGQLTERHRRRAAEPRFDFNKDLKQRVIDFAAAQGITLDAAMNNIVQSFFGLLDVERRRERAQAADKGSRGKSGKAGRQ